MHIVGWFDNRLFSILISVVIFLLIMTAIRKITIPASEPLTFQIRIIEEIKKYIRPVQPVSDTAPQREKRTVQPRKRLVPRHIETALNRLRESQAPREVKSATNTERPILPKLDLKKPSSRRQIRDPRLKMELGNRLRERQKRNDPIDKNVIEIAAGTTAEEGVEYDPLLRGFVEGAKERPSTGTRDETVRISIEESWSGKGTGEDVISDVMQPLIRWMKEHPAEFSSVEKKFLHYDEGDLTSRALFLLDDKTLGEFSYELLLLFKPSTNELRICLIQGDTATQLIDKGLQERSNYLRTGIVSYNGEEKISIQSTQQVPNEETTRLFYRIFLSWWNRTQKG